MPSRPLQPPSSEYSPVSRKLADSLIGKTAKVVTYSKIKLVSNKDGQPARRKQVIDENVSADNLDIVSLRFVKLSPVVNGKGTLILFSDFENELKQFDYDADLDVFVENHGHDNSWYSVPIFV